MYYTKDFYDISTLINVVTLETRYSESVNKILFSLSAAQANTPNPKSLQLNSHRQYSQFEVVGLFLA